jgi:hypothetical protein
LTLPEKSILAKQINDSIYVLLKMDSPLTSQTSL